MGLLFDLADIAEDLFFFGMKPPEIPPRPFQRAQRKAVARLAAGGVDDGFPTGPGDTTLAARPGARCAETCDLMWQSIRLALMAR